VQPSYGVVSGLHYLVPEPANPLRRLAINSRVIRRGESCEPTARAGRTRSKAGQVVSAHPGARTVSANGPTGLG